MESSHNKKLGLRIRELRIAKGIKQGQIADLLDMERSNFTRIESGKQAPTDKNLEKIATILGVHLKDLYDFEHLKTRDELISLITKLLPDLTDKELRFCYKSLENLLQMR